MQSVLLFWNDKSWPEGFSWKGESELKVEAWFRIQSLEMLSFSET